MRGNASRSATLFILAVASLSAACLGGVADWGLARPAQEKSVASTQRAKVAQGEYVVFERENGGAVGPFGEEVYNFHETWTLWRSANGSYEVEGERRFESPKDALHTNRFAAQLSRDLTLTRVTEFARLKWRSDSGPLSCEFLRTELDCSSNARDGKKDVDLKIPMKQPFGLFWPISAFSLSGITREAERDPNQPTRVQLVSIEQPSAEIPVSPTIQEGELRYLGAENIDIAGHTHRAFKFSIKIALFPELIASTSPRGLLLAVAIRHEGKDFPEESMKLVQLQEWAGFE